MLNATHVLDRLNISSGSAIKAIQEVRQKVEASSDKLKAAIEIITNVTGKEVSYVDENLALHIAQDIVRQAIEAGDKFDPDNAIKDAEAAEAARDANPALQWLKATKAATQTPATPTTTATRGPLKIVAGVNVTIKANGKIKKGGKQDAADALYLEHAVGGKVKTNQELVAVFMKELDMSKPGATTYVYDAKKRYEAAGNTPVELEKSVKGRKAKV
jgi:DNA-dependent RNA polymerase auxiliary subunit epsilon